MGNWEAAVNRNFKRDAQGRAVYFPFGVLGPGRVVSREAEARLRRFLRGFQWTVLPLMLLFLFLDLRYVWYLMGGYYAAFFCGELLLLRGSQPSPERLSLGEYAACTAAHGAASGLLGIVIFSGLFAALCVYVLVLNGQSAAYRLLGLVAAAVCLFYAAVSAWALHLKGGGK